MSEDYPRCGAKTRTEGAYPLCPKKAGWGTDHVGEGRCRLHGGMSVKGKDHYRYRTGLTSKVGLKEMRQLADEYLADPDVFNFRDLIATLKAAFTMATNGGDMDKTVHYGMQIAKAIKMLSEIEEGKKYTVNIKEVEVMADQIYSIIQRHVSDREVMLRIAKDLQRLNIIDALPASEFDDDKE